MIFISGCLLLLLIALLVIWLPFLLKKDLPINHYYRQKVNANIYQQQLINVEKEFTQDEQIFKLLKNELALGLLIEESETEVKPQTQRETLFLPVIMSLLVVVLSLVGYGLFGHYHQANDYIRQVKQNPLAGLTEQEIIDVQLVRLQDKIKANPQDIEAWFVLVEYYLYHNQFDDALIALDKITAINGETNQVLAGRALVLYYQNGQRINSDVQQLLDRILYSDPLQVTALMLIASDFYNHGRYQQAVEVWQRLLDSGNNQVDRTMLIERINIAKMMVNRG